MNPINEAASLITFFTLLLVFKKEVQSTNEILFEHSKPSSPPGQREFFFYLLFFWAMVASLLGGLFWNLFFQGTLGGSEEPHGWAAILWSIVTTLPLILTLIVLNKRYKLALQKQTQLYIAFLVGVAIGSAVFYDLPLSGEAGFRLYFEAQNLPYANKEFWLVVIWSSLLASPGFLLMGITRLWLIPMSRNTITTTWLFFKQSALVIGLTTSAVSLFIWAFDDQSRFDSARGIVAGIFLRVAMFFGIFIGSYAEKILEHGSSKRKKKGSST